MTKNNIIFRRSMVIGIILFIGASVVPCVSSINNNMLHESMVSKSDSFNPFEEGWQYRKQITIDHTKVDGDLVNFPVLISVVDSDLQAKAQDDGDDILFMDDIGFAGKLNHEIELYNGSTGEIIAWVNVTSLSSTIDTNFYVYYGNSSCGSQENVDGTWDSDYKSVYHLYENSGVRADSTSNNLHFNVHSGTPSATIGKIGKCQDFDGNERLYRDNVNLGTSHTISFWLKFDALTTYDVVMGTDGSEYILTRWNSHGSYVYANSKGGGSGEVAINTQDINDDTVIDVWYYLTIVREGTAYPDFFGAWYVNGTYDTGIVNDGSNSMSYTYLGGFGNPDNIFKGQIDELRVSTTKRSASWISTDYNNQNDPSSFFSVGPEELPNLPPNPPSDPDPNNGETYVDVNAILSWTCSDPDGDSLVYDVYFEKNDPNPDDLVSYHQPETFFDPPGQMEHNTNYYWQIVAWDPYDESTAGPVWAFITGSEQNDPPNEPSMPNPPDDATDVDIDVDLSWSCSDPDGDNIVYDVYFEADDPDPDIKVSNDQTVNFFDPETLLYWTDYYWQIIAKDEHGAATPGPIWHFTTGILNNPPSIPTINGPKSGKVGNIYTYSFIAIDPDGDDVFYEIDWGDGQVDPWYGPHPSNTVITRDHDWGEEGSFTIRARAKDDQGASGDWGQYDVTVTKKSRAIITPFLNWLQSYLNMFPILKLLLQQFGLQ